MRHKDFLTLVEQDCKCRKVSLSSNQLACVAASAILLVNPAKDGEEQVGHDNFIEYTAKQCRLEKASLSVSQMEILATRFVELLIDSPCISLCDLKLCE